MGLFSALGSLFSGNAQKKAAQQAQQAQVDALNRGITLQNDQFQQTRSDYMPYTQAGTAAIGQIGNFQGLNGQPAQDEAFAGLRADPRYASLFTDGRDALLARGAATGGLRGGNVEGALAQLSPQVLSSVYDMVLSGLGGTANMGLGAQGQVANFGAHTADVNTGLNSEIGTAQAANYLTRGGINAKNWANIGGALDNAVSAGFGGAGGGFSLTGALKSILG